MCCLLYSEVPSNMKVETKSPGKKVRVNKREDSIPAGSIVFQVNLR